MSAEQTGKSDSHPREWLVDGHAEPTADQRRIAQALEPARWSGDTTDLLDRLGEARVPPSHRRSLRLSRYPWRTGLLAAAIVLAGLAVWLAVRPSQPSAWTFASGDSWRVGQWVESASNGQVRATSSIGRVTLGPGSRARMVQASRQEHRIELAEGSMEAFILAPPRLFFVDTPSATAVDMGCAYRLEVDARGAGMLHVTAGWVELQAEPTASRVPSGASCRIEADRRLGIPVFDDASTPLRDAVSRLEEGDLSGLSVVLGSARPRDSLTLWHLLARTQGPDRERVLERLAELAPPPDGADREQVLALEQRALEAWWLVVRRSW